MGPVSEIAADVVPAGIAADKAAAVTAKTRSGGRGMRSGYGEARVERAHFTFG